MNPKLKFITSSLILSASTSAIAQPGGSPSGGLNWIVFGGGFGLGLGLGLLLCWLRCRGKKEDDNRKR